MRLQLWLSSGQNSSIITELDGAFLQSIFFISWWFSSQNNFCSMSEKMLNFYFMLKINKCGKIEKNRAKKNWARVIRKYINWGFWHQNLILETWNWKLIKNTWSIKGKILKKYLKIQASLKVRFLQRNDEMPRMKIF